MQRKRLIADRFQRIWKSSSISLASLVRVASSLPSDSH